MEPYGPQALAAFKQAAQLVKEGKYEEARAVNLLSSDRKTIERRIAEAQKSLNANYSA